MLTDTSRDKVRNEIGPNFGGNAGSVTEEEMLGVLSREPQILNVRSSVSPASEGGEIGARDWGVSYILLVISFSIKMQGGTRVPCSSQSQ